MKKAIIIAGASLLVVVLAIGVFIFVNGRFLKIGDSAEKPAFALDQMRGWYTGGNYWYNPDEFTGDQTKKDELPIAGMSVHQGNDEQDIVNGHCFTLFAYFDKTINVDEALKRRATATGDDGRVVTEIGVSDLKMTTYEGVKNFQLHKYDLSGPAAKDLQRGMANGYVTLSSGYINVQSVCQESAQLDETLPVLEAVRLDIRKVEG